jgi:hypothetical protein
LRLEWYGGILLILRPLRPFKNLSKEQFHHAIAFELCISRAEQYLRDHASPQEVATVVAEDVPEMRRFLQVSVQALHQNPVVLTADMQTPTKAERGAGTAPRERELKSTRIVDCVHFVSKKDAFLLQLADACAFAFRRYFSLQKHGEQFVVSMLGVPLVMEDFGGPSSGGLFYVKSL